jgi:tRNA (guanine-N7-)-methyltransferase
MEGIYMRTRKKKWTAKELSENPRILHEPEIYALRFKEFFANDNPIHLELGCGKGRFITQTAALYPQIHHIAIEREPSVLAAAARLSRETGGSLVFIRADAVELPSLFIPGDISRLYINFCDPWPNKKKWAKRRLTHENFLRIYEHLKIPEIFFKTDNQLLFEFSIESFSARNWRMRNVSLDLRRSDMEGNVRTEYEEKFSAHGPIYRMEAYRDAADAIAG